MFYLLKQCSLLSFYYAYYRDSDSGLYTCKAQNEDGETSWTASLNIEGKLKFVFLILKFIYYRY